MNIAVKSQAITAGRVSEAMAESAVRIDRKKLGQIVLVLQGGGALGAYQAGVYQALQEAGIEPDWVIGTSIGAINASLIAGNPPEVRLERLRQFWDRVRHNPFAQMLGTAPFFGPWAANALTISAGVRGFFEPNPWAFTGMKIPLGAELAGFYSTRPLERTLEKLTNEKLLNAGEPRLTVGAANLNTGEMRYFDSRDMPLTVSHIMASGALPPAFPAVRIGDDLYWDGGILSNTPVEAVFDDYPRRSGLVFAVHMWNPNGPEPKTIWEVMGRQKDLQYSSRAASHIARRGRSTNYVTSSPNWSKSCLMKCEKYRTWMISRATAAEHGCMLCDSSPRRWQARIIQRISTSAPAEFDSVGKRATRTRQRC
jgi:NTE family protein